MMCSLRQTKIKRLQYTGWNGGGGGGGGGGAGGQRAAGARWLERVARVVLAEGSQPVSFYNISVDLRCVASRER